MKDYGLHNFVFYIPFHNSDKSFKYTTSVGGLNI